MNQIPDELLLYRPQFRDAIERDPLAGRRSRIAIRPRVAIPALGVLAAATAAVVLGFALTASTPSAYAAAKRALAATKAASSGTMTLGGGFGQITTEWNDGNIALTGGKVLGPLQQFLIVDGGVYVQQSDDSWLHYADADNVPAVIAGPGDPTMQLRMIAGSDGTVQEVDLTRGDTVKFTYSDLGSTPPITAPASATDMAPDAVPPDFTGGGEVFAAPASPK